MIQKTAGATGDLIGSKIFDRITKVPKTSYRLIQKQLQVNMIKKYLNKDIYLQKKDRKLLII